MSSEYADFHRNELLGALKKYKHSLKHTGDKTIDHSSGTFTLKYLHFKQWKTITISNSPFCVRVLFRVFVLCKRSSRRSDEISWSRGRK